MEIASLLVGESWSDHPACTHPVLAAVARMVNDLSSEEGRQALAPLIPSVIGTNVADPRIGPQVAVICVEVALQHARPRRRPKLVPARQAAERRLARRARIAERFGEGSDATGRSDGASHRPGSLRTAVRRWLTRADLPTDMHRVQNAVQAIARDCRTDRDAVLRQVLTTCIDACRQRSGAATVDDIAWAADNGEVNSSRPGPSVGPGGEGVAGPHPTVRVCRDSH